MLDGETVDLGAIDVLLARHFADEPELLIALHGPELAVIAPLSEAAGTISGYVGRQDIEVTGHEIKDVVSITRDGMAIGVRLVDDEGNLLPEWQPG